MLFKIDIRFDLKYINPPQKIKTTLISGIGHKFSLKYLFQASPSRLSEFFDSIYNTSFKMITFKRYTFSIGVYSGQFQFQFLNFFYRIFFFSTVIPCTEMRH